jgi:regulatory protein
MLPQYMRSVPRKLSNDEALYAAALRALVRRAHSVFEMQAYLKNRAEESAAVNRILARLREQKLLDDARYALDFARSRANLRRQGRYRITQELRRRGIADQHIESAVALVFSETDETMLVRKVIERRLRLARGAFDPRKRASLYRTLLRAGFDSQTIRRELRDIPVSTPKASEMDPDQDDGNFPVCD